MQYPDDSENLDQWFPRDSSAYMQAVLENRASASSLAVR
jgi:hypothetical protein